MKKVWIVIICAVIVLLPTAALLGYHFYFGNVKPDIVTADLVSATVRREGTDPVECGKDDRLLKIFAGMHGTKEERPEALTSLPEEAHSYVKYEVTYLDSYDVESTFTYYLSADKNKCYYTDGEQRAYRLTASSAEEYLNSDYSEPVYKDALAPTVRLGSVELTPYTLDWSYKTVDGLLKKATCSYSDRDETTAVGSFDAIFALDSDREPDETYLVIKDEDTGSRYYAGNGSNLDEIEISGSKNVTVDMTLTWKNDASKNCAGSAKYYFKGRMFGTAAFSFSTGLAKCGDVVILSAFNVIDPKTVTITTEPEFGFTPEFYKVGDNWQALIPLAQDLVDSETCFTFDIASSSATDKLTLTVAPLEKKTYVCYWPSASKIYTESVISSLRENLMPIVTRRSDFSFAGGKFVIPAVGNHISETANYDFGTEVTITNVNKTYTAWDTMYLATMGTKVGDTVTEGTNTEVLAAFDGKVVYVGSQTFTGRIVIIDHGSGLMTWYTNLSSDISVRQGDTVTAGQFISHAADGGLNADLNFQFHVGASVGGVPVDLQKLITNGLIA